MVDSWDAREEAPTIGYYAFFELTNGFRKAIYWSKKQMMAHADKFSPAFSANGQHHPHPVRREKEGVFRRLRGG